MRRTVAGLAFLVLAVPSANAGADAARPYFPLQHGNRWTYDASRAGGGSTLKATRLRSGVFRLDGFPGAPALRVRWSGGVLQAWDAGERRWEAFLRLGAPKGTEYGVDLHHPLWQDVRIRVASRNASVRIAPLRRSVSRAVWLALEPSPSLSDAGVVAMVFAPGVGLVTWNELTFTGPSRHALSSARVGGRTLGRG